MNSWKGEFLMTNTKKKHGNKMKLMSAIGMLTVSAAMLVSSTFAWFSMNKTVTAQSMTINAKSDGTFLLIDNGDNDTADEIQATQSSSVTWIESAATLFPSAPVQSATEVGYTAVGKKTTAGTDVTTAGAIFNNRTGAALYTNWYTANADDPTKTDIDATTAKQLAAFTGYVIKETMYMTVADGSNGANNLTVTPNFTQVGAGNDLTAARMLVVTSDGGFAILNSSQNGTKVDIKGSNTTLTDTTVLTVDVYFYIDGNAEKVYTNNRTNLTGVQMDLTFDVDAVADNH
jgi:hypothetical protein